MAEQYRWEPVDDGEYPLPDDGAFILYDSGRRFRIRYAGALYEPRYGLPDGLYLCQLQSKQPSQAPAPEPGPGNVFGYITPDEIKVQYDALLTHGGPEAADPFVTATRLARWIEAKYRLIVNRLKERIAELEKERAERQTMLVVTDAGRGKPSGVWDESYTPGEMEELIDAYRE